MYLMLLAAAIQREKINKGKKGSHTTVLPLGDVECGEDNGVKET